MNTFKDRGIILKETKTGESNKLVTLLLKEHGKVIVSARGASGAKSKFAAATQPFAYCDFVIYKGSGFLSLAQINLIESFYELRTDFERYCLGSFFLEIADKMILAEMPAERILYLLIKALSALTKNKLPTALINVVFLFKFLQLEGLSPVVDTCSGCGKPADDLFLDSLCFNSSGLLCKSCAVSEPKPHKTPYIKVSGEALSVINHILESETKEIFSFSVSQSVLNELTRTADLFRAENVDITFKSLQLIK